MATIERFEDITAWQKAREMTRAIYEVSRGPSFFRDVGLREQIRRASVSSMSNIAEGFERGGAREFVQFLSVAKGSTGEVESQLYVALDQEYITTPQFEDLKQTTELTKKLIGGFMYYLAHSGRRGGKFPK